MITTDDFAVVLVTVPELEVGRAIANSILEARVAACVNILPGVESLYWWEGKIDRSAEAMLVIKTTRDKLSVLEQLILRNHPYDTPEFIVLPIQAGAERYLQWLRQSMD